MKELKVFDYKGNEFHTLIADGVIWCLANDVKKCLGYAENAHPLRLFSFVPSPLKRLKHNDTSDYDALYVSIHGLYFFLGSSSRQDEAMSFECWFRDKALPVLKRMKFELKSFNEVTMQVSENKIKLFEEFEKYQLASNAS